MCHIEILTLTNLLAIKSKWLEILHVEYNTTLNEIWIDIISLIKSMQYRDILLDKDKYQGVTQYHTKDKDK